MRIVMEDDETKSRKPWQFQPGNDSRRGFAKNRRKPQAIAIRRLSAAEFAETVQVILTGNVAALEFMARDRTTTEPLKAMIASVALRCIERGDHNALDSLLNRLIGRPKEMVEIKATGPEERIAELRTHYTALMANPETAAALRLVAEKTAQVPETIQEDDNWEPNTIGVKSHNNEEAREELYPEYMRDDGIDPEIPND